ncbi:MAG: Enoyl-CoA hydratase/isomerase [Bradyrhizobium sp.]|nr:Enoyl-CoA hydratase/isomerase [Bradyrhizobium sp.]
MYDKYEFFSIKQDGPVLEITINRPDQRNAITFAMEEEIDDILLTATDDDSVRVVTLRGAGKVFSAGHDLKEVAGRHSTGTGSIPHRIPKLRRMWYFPKPIIAAVHGFVGPIAIDLIAHCDFVIAAEGTRFSFEQARMGAGIIYWSPMVFMFPMRVWKKLTMTGGWFTAEQGEKWDFVQRVVPPEKLDETLRAWANEIAQVPPRQTRSARIGIHRQYELMGLAAMALVQNSSSGHGADVDQEFFRRVLSEGVGKALSFRQTGADDSITQV